MVLKESMRLFAPIPFVQRQLKSDQMIGGHLIPKDTTIVIGIFMLHRNPKVFPEPEKFDPERFAEGKEYSPTAYIPFSAGSRNCIGYVFVDYYHNSISAKNLRLEKPS
jgi:cytochrome P450 family 4